MRAPQPRQRLEPSLLPAEHAHVHPRVPQVRARLHAGDGHKSHPGSLEFACHRLADHLAYRLVDATHPVRAHTLPSYRADPIELALYLARLVGLEHIALAQVLEVLSTTPHS